MLERFGLEIWSILNEPAPYLFLGWEIFWELEVCRGICFPGIGGCFTLRYT